MSPCSFTYCLVCLLVNNAARVGYCLKWWQSRFDSRIFCLTECFTCPPLSVVSRYCPGGPDSDFEYSTQSYTGYEVKTYSWLSAMIQSVAWQVPTFLEVWAFFLIKKLFAGYLTICVPSHRSSANMSISYYYFWPLSQVLCPSNPFSSIWKQDAVIISVLWWRIWGIYIYIFMCVVLGFFSDISLCDSDWPQPFNSIPISPS